MLHRATGWTYAATGFIPGDGSVAQWSTDLAPYDDIIADEPFSWKRTNLNQMVEGSKSEGIIYRITTTSNRAVLRMDMHLSGVLE